MLILAFGNTLDLYLDSSLTRNYAELPFEYLCPKKSGISDWIANTFRFILLLVSYVLSLKTYKELDFKRFIFLIFLLCNSQVILRFFFLLFGLNISSYH